MTSIVNNKNISFNIQTLGNFQKTVNKIINCNYLYLEIFFAIYESIR